MPAFFIFTREKEDLKQKLEKINLENIQLLLF